MIDLTFRCFSKARWLTVATSRGIYDAQGKVTDGFVVDEIGNATLTTGVSIYNGPVAAPTIITPTVIDTWFWVNLRVHGQAQLAADLDALFAGEIVDGFAFTTSKLAAFVRNQAIVINILIEGQTIKTYEFGLLANRVQLLDPRSYAAFRRREWLGGMSF